MLESLAQSIWAHNRNFAKVIWFGAQRSTFLYYFFKLLFIIGAKVWQLRWRCHSSWQKSVNNAIIDGIQYSGATVFFFWPHPPFPMFLWRFTWGLWYFNVLTREIVFTWVVIRLKVIVAIFATFLSTELYAFEVPVISDNTFSEGKKSEKLQNNSCRLLCVCYALYTNDYMFNNLWWPQLIYILHHININVFSWRF